MVARQLYEMLPPDRMVLLRTPSQKVGCALQHADVGPYSPCCHCCPQVRRTPSWPGSRANFALLLLCSHRNAWADRCVFLASLTPFSLQYGCLPGKIPGPAEDAASMANLSSRQGHGLQFLSLVISLAQTCLMSCARLTTMIARRWWIN